MTLRRMRVWMSLLFILSVACGEANGELSEPAEQASSPRELHEIVQAATAPTGFVDEVVVTGLSAPTALAFAPDGRAFIAQQNGRLRVVKNGALLAQDFLTVSTTSSGERGLLGVAFDPNFASNQFVYVYYTALTPAVHNRISRFRAQGDVAVAGSETILLELDNLSSATNHNGGAMHFGGDGKLYVGVGENATPSNAQSMNNLLGKMLRLNADGSIPSDNPFFAKASGKNRAIWALGLRNPYTFAIARSGRIFINDVGQNTWEEINEGTAGANYGWPLSEGVTSASGQTSPLFVYPHTGTVSGCAIAGGAFYDPPNAPYPSSYVGKYFFADYCSNWVRVFDPSSGTSAPFLSNAPGPVDLAVGTDGLLYRLERGGSSGQLARVRYASGQAPAISSQPANRTVAAGQTVTFSVTASGSQPLNYQWQRNSVNIAGATAASYTLTATAADSGAAFRVVVSNGSGSVTSNGATLTVSQNAAPVATMTAPAGGAQYSAGDTITYSANATDAEDGTLPASAFTWEVVFHHAAHTHPFMAATSGQRSGTFVVPRLGHTETDVFYRIRLRVRDSAGLESEVTRDITPRLATISLQTSPAGLALTLDGSPVATPTSVPGVVGVTRTLAAPSPQTLGGKSYIFSSWSDGGAVSHDINTPSTNTTYTATFRETTASTNLAAQGQIVARTTASRGPGGSNLEIIRDGVKPSVGSSDSAAQWDSYSGGAATQDWVGYTFTQSYQFNRVVLQEGRHYWYGGFWENLTVQVRLGSTWSNVPSVTVTPSYPGNNNVSYETFELRFPAIAGTGIRLFGRPGGLLDFVTVAELEVYGQ